MAGFPPVPPPMPPPGYDPRAQRRYMRDQVRAQKAAFRAQREQIRYQMRGMRRGSVLGPLLLIAAGIVFLLIQTGHLDHSRFWGWFGQWWPLLLVIAGVLVLAEWAVDQFLLRDPLRPPYRRTLGGGVVFLLLIIVGTGLIARHAHEDSSGYSKLFPGFQFDEDSLDELIGDKHESDQTLDLTRPNTTALTIADPHGDITVSGTSDDDRIHVAVHKQIYSRSDSDAESKAQQYSPAVDMSAPEPSIRMPSLDGARADLVITVPALTTLTVTANHGDIHVTSLKGAVTATANHGDIELSAISNNPVSAHLNSAGSSLSARNIDGAVAIQGRGQDITLADIAGAVNINGEFFGDTHMEHVRGAIHFHTSRTDLQYARLDGETDISSSGIASDQVLGPVVLTTSNRNVTLDRVAGDIAVTNRNGSIDLSAAAPLGNITLEDRNDSIQLTLPEKANFTVQADTTNGDLSTGLPLTVNSSSESHKSLSGTVGSGGPLIHITTTNSDITINKGDVQPLAPTPPAPPKITLAPPATPSKTKAAAPKTPAAPPAASN